ncbi:hypothetical protein [Bdellovibrio sp. HCB209]|uniref:hypothetical protein n=1 Tax=Bdellovibrio sp. HCB209 TaxID=3394354 RepID=UPI0039B641BC
MKCLNKKSLILAALIIGNLTVAQASVGSFKTTEITDDAYLTEEMIGEDAAAIDVARSLKRIGADKVCKSVVNEEEEGRYYKAVERAFQKNEFPMLTAGTKDLIAACPKYSTLSQKEKEEVWTTILGSMAFYESTCRQLGARQGGPNGSLGGPFQLHVGKERNYGKLCRSGDATTTDANRFIPCVLSMLEGYMKKQESKGSTVKLFPPRGAGATYWEVLQSDAAKRFKVTSEVNGQKKVLRGNGADFVKLAIKDYKYCR